MLDRHSPVPLYYQLAEEIKQKIKSGDIVPGDKLPSETEMIKQYDIGRLTIRMALLQLVNSGYLEKIHGKGTFCKSAQIGDEALNIDVILDMTDTYFIPYYIKSISEVLTENNCNFIISDSKDNTLEILVTLHKILEKGTSGVIVHPSHLKESVPAELSECFRQYRSAGIPYVMIDSTYDGIEASYTIFDEEKGGQMVARYLHALCHKKTLAIYIDNYKDSTQRLNGFTAEWQKLTEQEPIVLTYNGNTLSKDLLGALEKYAPTALFCYNDAMAVECLNILREHSIRVPEDISIIGFDDSILAVNSVPPLTSVAHPKHIMGELAARVLLELIRKNRQWPYTNVFAPTLVERDSCISLKR